MCFEVANGHLGCIASVAPRGHEFQRHVVVVSDHVLHGIRHLIVEYVFLGLDADALES